MNSFLDLKKKVSVQLGQLSPFVLQVIFGILYIHSIALLLLLLLMNKSGQIITFIPFKFVKVMSCDFMTSVHEINNCSTTHSLYKYLINYVGRIIHLGA